MRGYAQDIEVAYESAPLPFDRQVVALFVQSGFPEPELVTEAIRRGTAHDPQTVWVVRDKDRLAVAALEEAGVDYLPLALNPDWHRKTDPGRYDVRASIRECEMVLCSSHVLVFVKPDPGSLKSLVEKHEISSRLRTYSVITRGAKKARARKGRKPVGV